MLTINAVANSIVVFQLETETKPNAMYMAVSMGKSITEVCFSVKLFKTQYCQGHIPLNPGRLRLVTGH
jgi:hypothetical protein